MVTLTAMCEANGIPHYCNILSSFKFSLFICEIEGEEAKLNVFSATKVCLTLSSNERSTVSTQWFVSLYSKLMTWRVLLCQLLRLALTPFIVTQTVVDYCYQDINSQLLLIGVVMQLCKYFEYWTVNFDIPRCVTHMCTTEPRQTCKWSDFTDPFHWMRLNILLCLLGTLYFWKPEIHKPEKPMDDALVFLDGLSPTVES